MHTLHKVMFIFVIIGALNWGAVGLLNFNLVTVLFGQFAPFVERIVYVLVGAAGLIELLTHYQTCCSCNPNCSCDVGHMPASKMKSKKRK